MITRKYWPLNDDTEGEIYENPAWDLPGLRRKRGKPQPSSQPPNERKRSLR
jgi:hypothetical protein